MGLYGPESQRQMRIAARVSAVGLELVLAIAVGYLGGQWLDTKFGTAPYLKFIGFGLGVIAGFKGLFSAAKKFQTVEKESKE